LCSLLEGSHLEGSVKSFLALHANYLHKVCIILVVVILMRLACATGLIGCPIKAVPVQSQCIGWYMCPVLLAEVAMFLGLMDQPFACFLQNLGVNRFHILFCCSPFCLVGAQGLVIDSDICYQEPIKRAPVISEVNNDH
jgi:hypothetical protein